MRATRGLVASLGAGLSLILAGSVALMLCSALIAFEGWPGARAQRTPDERALVAVVSGAPVRHVTPAKLRLPAPRRTSRTVAAGHAAAGGTHAASRGTRRSVVTAPSRVASAVPAAHSAPAAAPTSPAAPKKTTAKLKLPAAGATVQHLGGTLDTAVAGTGKTVGDVVKPLLPAVGTAVTLTTAQAGQLLQQVTGVVGQLVDGVLTPTGR